MEKKTAIIIGAGPAGITAAEQLQKHTDIKPVLIETESKVGGISKTVIHNGNRMDFGGHRFFSKSDKVMQWWMEKLPPEASLTGEFLLDPNINDNVLLLRNRLSRIYHRRRFFNYPISLSWHTIRSLGFFRSIGIGISYFRYSLFPIRNEKNLEDFFTNRFGKKLYNTFFKDYTEKVWGVPCSEISPEWGGQRVKGLSVSKAIKDAVTHAFRSKKDIEQKETETSLIRRFLYPKLGPGQMWEKVTEEIINNGGEIHMQTKALELIQSENKITGIKAKNLKTGEYIKFDADYVFSTMPISELIKGMNVPENINRIAKGLIYRDFITVGLLVDKLIIDKNKDKIKDNWIYIQESDVKLGRLQIFNNWSPYLVDNADKYWLGLEYFCYENDDFWNMKDQDIINLAIEELSKIDIILKEDVADSTVYRVPKAYPAYFGTYNQLDEIKKYTDIYTNLFLIGRNGMHKYNNQDHSMLSAMTAVDNIVTGRTDKSNIWNVNTESAYHESKNEI
jgi:protoporphyrinogen oxidase